MTDWNPSYVTAISTYFIIGNTHFHFLSRASLSFHLPMFITLSIFFILSLFLVSFLSLYLFPFAYVYNSLYLFHSFFLSFNLPMFISLSLRPSLSLYSLSLSFFHLPMFISLSLFILSHNLPFSIPLSFPFVYVYVSLFKSFYALVRDSTFNCLSLAPVCTYLGMFQYSFYRYQVLYVIVVFLSVSISVLSICLYAFIWSPLFYFLLISARLHS